MSKNRRKYPAVVVKVRVKLYKLPLYKKTMKLQKEVSKTESMIAQVTVCLGQDKKELDAMWCKLRKTPEWIKFVQLALGICQYSSL